MARTIGQLRGNNGGKVEEIALLLGMPKPPYSLDIDGFYIEVLRVIAEKVGEKRILGLDGKVIRQ